MIQSAEEVTRRSQAEAGRLWARYLKEAPAREGRSAAGFNAWRKAQENGVEDAKIVERPTTQQENDNGNAQSTGQGDAG